MYNTLGMVPIHVTEALPVSNTSAVRQDHALVAFLEKYYSLVLIIFGTLGNLLCLAVLSRQTFRRSSAGIYLRFLTLADLAAIYTGVLYFTAKSLFDTNFRKIDELSCKFHRWMSFVACDLSSWALVLVSSARLISIAWPMKRLITRRRVYASIIFTIIFLLGANLPIFIIYGNVKNPRTNRTLSCVFTEDSYQDFYNHVFSWLVLLKFAFLPGVLLIVLNTALVCSVSRSGKAVDKMASRSVGRSVLSVTNLKVRFSKWRDKVHEEKCQHSMDSTTTSKVVISGPSQKSISCNGEHFGTNTRSRKNVIGGRIWRDIFIHMKCRGASRENQNSTFGHEGMGNWLWDLKTLVAREAAVSRGGHPHCLTTKNHIPASETHPRQNQATETHPRQNQASETHPRQNQATETHPRQNQASETHPRKNPATETHPRQNQASETHPRQYENRLCLECGGKTCNEECPCSSPSKEDNMSHQDSKDITMTGSQGLENGSLVIDSHGSSLRWQRTSKCRNCDEHRHDSSAALTSRLSSENIDSNVSIGRMTNLDLDTSTACSQPSCDVVSHNSEQSIRNDTSQNINSMKLNKHQQDINVLTKSFNTTLPHAQIWTISGGLVMTNNVSYNPSYLETDLVPDTHVSETTRAVSKTHPAADDIQGRCVGEHCDIRRPASTDRTDQPNLDTVKDSQRVDFRDGNNVSGKDGPVTCDGEAKIFLCDKPRVAEETMIAGHSEKGGNSGVIECRIVNNKCGCTDDTRDQFCATVNTRSRYSSASLKLHTTQDHIASKNSPEYMSDGDRTKTSTSRSQIGTSCGENKCIAPNPDMDHHSCTKARPEADQSSCTKARPEADQSSCTKARPESDASSCTSIILESDESSCTSTIPESDDPSETSPHKCKQRLKRLNPFKGRRSSNGQTCSKAGSRSRSLTGTLLVLNSVFLLCNTPITVYLTGKTYFWPDPNEHGDIQDVVVTVANFTMYTNNSINFILYCVTGSRFRGELLMMFTELYHSVRGLVRRLVGVYQSRK